MWVGGPDGCEFVNHAYETFTGATADELQGRGWIDHIHSDDREEYLRAYRNASARGEQFEAVARCRHADGTSGWMKAIGVPRQAAGGQPAGYVGSSVDITDLKLAEEGLRDADRAKDEFLGTLGHELRNPLAAISNATYVLARLGVGSHPVSLEVIERQTRNMVRIVDDLLDITRIKHGKISLRIELVNVETIARGAVAGTEHERRQSDQQLEASFPPEPVWVLADPARMEQVLTNLLSNASRFAPPGGRIHLSVEREADAALIRVSDNGPGIDPAVLPRIFELFVQG